ncbi:MAG: response regulator [Oligoflexia bacterium]|nr:response regulator [Oligoflexia bacterium]
MASILFVDDDKVTQKLVKDILDLSGYDVIIIGDPRDAYDRLQQEHFDCLITDVNMPGGFSGFDLVRAVRKLDKTKKIPIAVVTGRRDPKDIMTGVQVGADDYIVKPIDPHIFLGKVETLLKKKGGYTQQSKFPEGPVRKPAKTEFEMEITYISERGVMIQSPVHIPEGNKILVNSDFYVQIGIKAPLLRVISCDPHREYKDQYFINANFYGLSDTDLQKIRSWLNTNFEGRLKTTG